MVRLQEVASVVITYFDLKWIHKVDLGVPLVGWRLHFVVMHHDCVTDRIPDVCELNRGWSTAVVTGLHDTLICHPGSA